MQGTMDALPAHSVELEIKLKSLHFHSWNRFVVDLDSYKPMEIIYAQAALLSGKYALVMPRLKPIDWQGKFDVDSWMICAQSNTINVYAPCELVVEMTGIKQNHAKRLLTAYIDQNRTLNMSNIILDNKYLSSDEQIVDISENMHLGYIPPNHDGSFWVGDINLATSYPVLDLCSQSLIQKVSLFYNKNVLPALEKNQLSFPIKSINASSWLRDNSYGLYGVWYFESGSRQFEAGVQHDFHYAGGQLVIISPNYFLQAPEKTGRLVNIDQKSVNLWRISDGNQMLELRLIQQEGTDHLVIHGKDETRYRRIILDSSRIP